MTNRLFKDNGFEPLFAYFILIFLFIGLSFYLFSRTEFAEYAYLLFSMALSGKLSETRRNEFLKFCFGDSKFKKIRILENQVLTFPFLLFLIYEQRFLTAAMLAILTTIVALTSFRTNHSFTLWTPFSKRPFEFTTGFRNTFYLLFAAYALTFIAVYVNNFNLGVFAMLLAFATTLGYYAKPENDYYIWIYNLNPKRFLFSKIKTAIRFSFWIAFPIALIIGIFFHQRIYVLPLFFLLGWAFLIGMIVSKYAAYPDELNLTQTILLMLCISLPPLLILLIPYLFRKSEHRLSSLLQ